MGDHNVRVALVADRLDSSRALRELTAQLRRWGIDRHRVVTIAADPAAEVPLPIANRVTLPHYPGAELAAPSRFALGRALSEPGFDLVHAPAPGPAGIGALVIARSLGLPATSAFDPDLAPVLGASPGPPATASPRDAGGAATPGVGSPAGALSAFYRGCRLVLSPTRSADRALERLGVAPAAIGRWQPGVDSAAFNPAHRTPRERRDGGFEVLHAGPLAPAGAALLADAFALARDRDPRLHLTLIGAGAGGRRLAERLGSAAAALGELAGEPLARRYANADLLVCPSAEAALVAPILEAQASGLPVLAVEGDASQLIQPGRTGCLVAPEPLAFAAALRWLARRGAVRERLTAGGLVAIDQRTWERSLDRLGDCWTSARGGWVPAAPGRAGVPRAA